MKIQETRQENNIYVPRWVSRRIRYPQNYRERSGVVVTAGTEVFGTFFYAEDPKGISGIRVYTDSCVPTGVDVKLVGHIYTLGGERVMDAFLVWPGDATTIPSALMMNNKALGGGSWKYDMTSGSGQCGVTGSFGINNIGLLVRTFGKFTYVDSHIFTIDDGSRVNIKCVVPDGVTLNPSWNYIAVTGLFVRDGWAGTETTTNNKNAMRYYFLLTFTLLGWCELCHITPTTSSANAPPTAT